MPLRLPIRLCFASVGWLVCLLAGLFKKISLNIYELFGRLYLGTRNHQLDFRSGREPQFVFTFFNTTTVLTSIHWTVGNPTIMRCYHSRENHYVNPNVR